MQALKNSRSPFRTSATPLKDICACIRVSTIRLNDVGEPRQRTALPKHPLPGGAPAPVGARSADMACDIAQLALSAANELAAAEAATKIHTLSEVFSATTVSQPRRCEPPLRVASLVVVSELLAGVRGCGEGASVTRLSQHDVAVSFQRGWSIRHSQCLSVLRNAVAPRLFSAASPTSSASF